MPVLQIRKMIMTMMQFPMRMNMDMRRFFGWISMLMKMMAVRVRMEMNVLNHHVGMSMSMPPDI